PRLRVRRGRQPALPDHGPRRRRRAHQRRGRAQLRGDLGQHGRQRRGRLRLPALHHRLLSVPRALDPCYAAGPTPMPPASAAASGDGAGALDCNGGRAGGDLDSFRDHNIDDTDPACVTGCREDGHCQGSLPGPHHDPALANPPSPPPAVCNGPPINDRTGTYGAGGMQLEVPVKVTLSAYWGVDGVPCTADDTYFFRDAPSTLALTTGSATGAILDAGNVLGATLEATDGGAPFDCARVKTGDLTGGELVGTLSLLDVPNLGQLT